MPRIRRLGAVCAALVWASATMRARGVHAQDNPAAPPAAATPAAPVDTGSAAEVSSEVTYAKELSNPVAALISVPFQSNFDDNIGPQREGQRYTLNIQPVIPITLTDDWNLISRTILPVVSQSGPAPGSGVQTVRLDKAFGALLRRGAIMIDQWGLIRRSAASPSVERAPMTPRLVSIVLALISV